MCELWKTIAPAFAKSHAEQKAVWEFSHLGGMLGIS